MIGAGATDRPGSKKEVDKGNEVDIETMEKLDSGEVKLTQAYKDVREFVGTPLTMRLGHDSDTQRRCKALSRGLYVREDEFR